MAQQVQCPNCHNYKVTTKAYRLMRGGRAVVRTPLMSLGCAGVIVMCGFLGAMTGSRGSATLATWLVVAVVVLVVMEGLRLLTMAGSTQLYRNVCQVCGFRWDVTPEGQPVTPPPRRSGV